MPKIYKDNKRSKVAARSISAAVTHAPATDPAENSVADSTVNPAVVEGLREIAPDPSSDFAGAFAQGEVVKFGGRKWNLRFLDLNDMIYLQKRVPPKVVQDENGKDKLLTGIEALDLDGMEGIRLFFYLVLRKSDPSLSEDDLDNERYKLTESAVGRMMSVENLTSPDTQKFINTILIRSGIAPDPAEKTRPNAAAGKAASP